MQLLAQLRACLLWKFPLVARHNYHFCYRFIDCFVMLRDPQYKWNKFECEIYVENVVRLWESRRWWQRDNCFHIKRAWCRWKIARTIGKSYCMPQERRNFARGDYAPTRLLCSVVSLVHVQWFLSCNFCALTRLVGIPQIRKELFDKSKALFVRTFWPRLSRALTFCAGWMTETESVNHPNVCDQVSIDMSQEINRSPTTYHP